MMILHTNYPVRWKKHHRKYSTNAKGARLVERALKCGATLRAIKAGDFSALTEKDVFDLINYFGGRNCEVMESLSFSGLSFQDERGRALGAIIRSPCLGIRQIKLSQIYMDKDAIRALIKGIQFATTLTKVNLSQCSFRDKDLLPLLQAVAANHSVKILELGENQFTRAGLHSLLDYIPQLSLGLDALGLSGNFLGPEASHSFSKLLQMNRDLKELDYSRNQLRAAGAVHLSNSLLFNRSLTRLNLESNELGSYGCERLCACLEHNYGLLYLNLSFNHIGDRGIEAICTMLKVNRYLQTLRLDMNRLTSASGRHISAMLTTNRTLKVLSLDSNLLLSTGISAIAAALKVNRGLESLSISDNELNDEGLLSLARALPLNRVLYRLVITKARIASVESYYTLIAELIHNTALKQLDIDYDFEGWETIHQGLQPITTRNYFNHRMLVRSALNVLTATRMLRLGDDSNCYLPVEIVEEIIKSLDPFRALSPQQFLSVVRFAMDRSTLDSSVSLSQFLTIILGEDFRTYPPPLDCSLLEDG